MLKALWFLVKLGVVIAAILWISERPGQVEMSWLSYDVKMEIGVFFAILAFLLVVLLLLHRGLLALKRAPKALALYHERSSQDKAQRAITQGLSAIAAGDTKKARQCAKRARALQGKEYGLVDLLESMTARMEGDNVQAQMGFERLLERKDTAFLGVRGLLQVAMDEGRIHNAVAMAENAHKMHPKQRWIVKTLYQLYIQQNDWNNAEKALRKAKKMGVVSASQALSDRIAMGLVGAQEALNAGDMDMAYSMTLKAYKKDKTSLPAALMLLPHYLRLKKRKAAIRLVEKVWKHTPHPDLLLAWQAMEPQSKKKKNPAKTMAWYERLLALKPDSDEGQMAVAEIAIRENMYGEARAYLKMAESLRVSKKLYRLYADLEQKQTGDEAAVKLWLEKAADAPSHKVWTCTQSGLVYERWSAFATPHNSFNTIIWDYPGARVAGGAMGAGFSLDSLASATTLTPLALDNGRI